MKTPSAAVIQKFINEGGTSEESFIAGHAAATQEAEELARVLEDLFAMMDEGQLIRDTSQDGGPDWSRHMARFVLRIKNANEALSKFRGRA